MRFLMKSVPIRLPKLGESVTEATIIEWMKQEGDEVQKDEFLVSVATDKVDTDLPSEYTGKLEKILKPAGSVVKVGEPIAYILTEDEVIEEDYDVPFHSTHGNVSEIDQRSNHQDQVVDIPKFSQGKFLSPVVREIIKSHGMSLEEIEKIPATGASGRLTKKDILAYLQSKTSQLVSANQRTPIRLIKEEGDREVPLSRVRKVIADNMLRSQQEVPLVTTFVECGVDKLLQVRNALKDEFFYQHGLKLTPTHLMMMCVIHTLGEFPLLNSWFNGEELLQKSNINLGFATAIPDGTLVVPNVKKAQTLSLLELCRSVNELAHKARNHQLSSDDTKDTTFTVSNTGIFGSMMGTPLVSPPQVAVLALGSIRRIPAVVVENDTEKISIISAMMMSLSYDHRIIDGGLASQFLMSLKSKIESFSSDVG